MKLLPILTAVFLASQSPEIPPLSASTTIGLPAAPEAVPIPEGVQVFYHWDDIPAVEFGPGFTRKVVVGETLSVSRNELDPRQVEALFSDPDDPHHHTFEQIAFGLKGELEWRVGGRKRLSGPGDVVVAGPDIAHALTRIPGTDNVVNIEFAVARRTDLLPSRPQVDFAAAAEPREVPEGETVYASFDALPWIGEPGTSRFKAIFGETSTLTMWHDPPEAMPGTSAPGHHHDIEQIVYVVEGHAMMRIGDQIEKVSPGTIVVVPSNVDHLSMSPIDDEEVILLDFQPVVRHDLRERMDNARHSRR